MSLKVSDESSDREIREAAERAVSSLPESPMQEGPPGKSAYQLAVEVEGFEGTVEEWLAHIHGEDGRTPQLRFEGTVIQYSYDGETWHDGPDLKGQKGDRGNDGDTGPAGPKGELGSVGPAGPVGATGVAGQKGDKGDVGPQGLRGDAGPAGPAGLNGSDGIVPMYGSDGKLWQGVVSREYETLTDGNGQWRIDYSALGFTAAPRVHPIAWYESSNAADQAVVTGATKDRSQASGRVVRGVSGSLLGLTSTWRFVPAGTPVTITVTGPTK